MYFARQLKGKQLPGIVGYKSWIEKYLQLASSNSRIIILQIKTLMWWRTFKYAKRFMSIGYASIAYVKGHYIFIYILQITLQFRIDLSIYSWVINAWSWFDITEIPTYIMYLPLVQQYQQLWYFKTSSPWHACLE